MSAHDFDGAFEFHRYEGKADFYVSTQDGRVMRPTFVLVTDAKSGLIESITVKEAKDGEE